MINTDAQFPEIQQLLDTHPKAAASLTQWVGDRLQAFQRYLAFQHEGESFLPPMDEEFIKKATGTMIQTNPSLLYAFFDGQEVFITVMVHINGDGKKEFAFDILEDKLTASGPTFPTRPQAEKAAFTKAFALLEDTLKENA